MSDDTVKGSLQKTGGHIKEAAGALAGDENLKAEGREDQVKGGAREAWGHVKDAGNSLVDGARGTRTDAAVNSSEADTLNRK